MNETNHYFPRQFWIAPAIIAVAILIGTYMIAQRPQPTQTSSAGNQPFVSNSIAVNGEGKVYATPDIFIFTVAINEKANTTKEAFTKANTKVASVRKALKDAGVADKDIQTTNISMYPHYEYNGTNSVPQGYEANQSLTITVRKLEDAGKVMDQVTNVDGAQIQSTQYDIDNKEKIFEEARAQAFTKAKEKAKQLAGLADVDLGKVSSISDVVVDYQPVPMYANAMKSDMAAGMGGGGSAELAPGQMVFTLSVNVIYSIE